MVSRVVRSTEHAVFSPFLSTKMDPRDFDFALRSGIGAPGNTEGPVDWNHAMTMMAISSAFLEKASQDAAEYARHANRPVYGKDIVMALKYNALPQTGFWSTENLQTKVAEWRTRLQEMMDESSSDEEGSEPEAAVEEEGEWEQVIADSPIVCGMNAAEDLFAQWQPSSEVDMIVHRAITRSANAL